MLIEFYGAECSHCQDMAPIVKKLQEEGLEIVQKETWHDEANAEEFEAVDKGRCGGVPFFVNPKTDAFICGEASEEDLRKLVE